MGSRFSLSDSAAALVGAAVQPHFETGLSVPRHSPGTMEQQTVNAVRDRISTVAECYFPSLRPIRVQWSSYNDPVRCQFACENREAADELPLLMSRLSFDLGIAVAGSAVVFKPTMLDEPVDLVLTLAKLHGVHVDEISGNRIAMTVTRIQEGAEAFDAALVAASPLTIQLVNHTGEAGCFFDRAARQIVNGNATWPGKAEIHNSISAKPRTPIPPPGFRKAVAAPSFAQLDRLLIECGAESDKNGTSPSRPSGAGGSTPELTPLKIVVKNTGLVFEDTKLHQLIATVELAKNRTPSFHFVLDIGMARVELEKRLGTCPAILTKNSGQIDCVMVSTGYPKNKLAIIRRVLGKDVPIRFPGSVP